MVRTDLIRLIAAQWPDLPDGDAEKIVSAFFDAIIQRLADGGRVEVRGFGSFTTRARDARTGRNPQTGDSVELADRRVPWFKAYKDLFAAINDGRSPRDTSAGNAAVSKRSNHGG
ncbi:HU family DNA-binding protein [Sphingomonas sp. PWP1-2]|uniref:HU family DNA-binding protein n=1 Tax=Sphingomonas sp. PWP1-2 TaxID=2804558 RepID=UPI003CF768F1